METQAIGRKIREIRLSQDLTQEQLAEKAEISPTHISVIERNIKLPQLDTFVAICNALGVTADEILADVLTASTKQEITEFSAILQEQPLPVQQTVLRAAKAIIGEANL